jgi:lactoylglutathione lyase
MDIVKPHIDVALFTNQKESMLRFWQDEAGLVFEELLPTGGGNHQHRHGVNGSVFKLNHLRAALPDAAPSGYRSFVIARTGVEAALALRDPDGNLVEIVPRRGDGVVGVAMRVAVRDVAAQDRFYAEVLGLPQRAEGVYGCGDSLLFVEEDADAARDPQITAPGYRYLTIQVRDCEAEHRGILERGGREGAPPRRLGEVAIFSMVRDPGGNWIEISQRASLTGPLGDARGAT